MAGKVSAGAGYLAILCAGTAAGFVALGLMVPVHGEAIARLAYIAAAAGFCFFTFWAVSATLIALRKPTSGK